MCSTVESISILIIWEYQYWYDMYKSVQWECLMYELRYYPISLLELFSLTLYTSQEFLISLLLRPSIINWRSHNMLLSVPLVSLDCVCHPISLCESSPETLLVLYSDLLWSWRFNMLCTLLYVHCRCMRYCTVMCVLYVLHVFPPNRMDISICTVCW